MYGPHKLFLLLALFAALSEQTILKSNYNGCDIALKTPLDPCSIMCVYEKIGAMRNGKFDINEVLISLDKHETLDEKASRRLNLLKVGYKMCDRYLESMTFINPCMFGTVMEFCVTNMMNRTS